MIRRSTFPVIALALSMIIGRGMAAESHRSPIAVAISEDRLHCLSANFTSGSVSLIDLDSKKMLQELSVGNGPVDVAWIDRETALVTLQSDDAVAIVRRNGDELRLEGTVPVGDEPSGLAISVDRRRAFIVLSGDDSVAVLPLEKLLKTRRAFAPDDIAPDDIEWLSVESRGRLLLHLTDVISSLAAACRAKFLSMMRKRWNKLVPEKSSMVDSILVAQQLPTIRQRRLCPVRSIEPSPSPRG